MQTQNIFSKDKFAKLTGSRNINYNIWCKSTDIILKSEYNNIQWNSHEYVNFLKRCAIHDSKIPIINLIVTNSHPLKNIKYDYFHKYWVEFTVCDFVKDYNIDEARVNFKITKSKSTKNYSSLGRTLARKRF